MDRCFFLGLFLFLVCGGMDALAQSDTIPDQKIEEVVVTAKLPVVEIKADRMIYHIESSVSRGQGSLYDILEKLPGVMISSDGTIYLNGQKGIPILLDGKLTYLSGRELVTLLKSTPASIADRVDLISHLSSRYDASGNSGMIDIRMKKMRLYGMNMTVNGDFSYGKCGTGHGSLAFNQRKDRVNIYLTYSYYKGTDCNSLQVTRLFTNPFQEENSELLVQQDSYRKYSQASHYYRVGADFFVSDQTTVGIYTNGNLFQSRMPGDMCTYFSAPFSSFPDSMLHTKNVQDQNRKNFAVGVNFTHQLDSAGKTADASFDYLHFGYKKKLNLQSYSHAQFEHPDSLRGNVPGTIDLYSGQVDLTLPFADKEKLEAGGKLSFISIENDASYMDNKGKGWMRNNVLSQHFIYNENINAGYIQCGVASEPFYVRAGLRLENTCVDGHLKGRETSLDSSFTSRYLNLFPSLIMEYKFSQGKFSLFYGRRINRPNYGDLNPFVYIFDNYTFEQGNTELKPEMSDNLELAYICKNLFKASFVFSHTQDVIVKSFLEKGNRQVYVTPMNLSDAMNLGPRIHTGNLPLTPFWAVNANAACIYNHFRWLKAGGQSVNKRLTFVSGLMNQIDFGKGWNLELSVSYNGKMAAGQATFSPVWQVFGGLRKRVLGGNGTIRLYARDLFKSYREKMELTVPGQQAFTDERKDNTRIGISFTYRFSKGYEVKESHRKSSMDERKRINL